MVGPLQVIQIIIKAVVVEEDSIRLAGRNSRPASSQAIRSLAEVPAISVAVQEELAPVVAPAIPSSTEVSEAVGGHIMAQEEGEAGVVVVAECLVILLIPEPAEVAEVADLFLRPRRRVS